MLFTEISAFGANFARTFCATSGLKNGRLLIFREGGQGTQGLIKIPLFIEDTLGKTEWRDGTFV